MTELDTAKFVLKLCGLAALVSLGLGAAEIYEHKAPWGMAAQITAAAHALPGKLKAAEKTGAEAQRGIDDKAFAVWDKDLKACRADRDSARDAASEAITRADAYTSKQAASAYKLGRASCKAPPHETSDPLLGPGGLRPSIGVPDLDDDFARLFGDAAFAGSPGAALPTGGGGARPG